MEAPVLPPEREPSDADLSTVIELSRDIARWDPVQSEERPPQEAIPSAAEDATRFLDTALALFDRLLSDGGPSRRARSSAEIVIVDRHEYSEQVDRLAASKTRSIVPDLAFVAKLEASQLRSDVLRAAASGSKWNTLIAAQRVRRRLLKGLTAIHRSLRTGRAADATTRDEGFAQELARSLQCRRALFRLWQRVATVGDPPLLQHLRLVGVSIAVLHGDDAYRDLRLTDRLQLLAVQRRLLDWLGDPNRSPRKGEQLLQDFMGFIALSRAVNQRPELVEHDRYALRIAADRLADPGCAVEAIADWLGWISGLNPALDALLAAGYSDRLQLREAIVAAQDAMAGGTAGGPRARPDEYRRAWELARG